MFDFERVTARTAALDWVPSSEAAKPPVTLAMPIDLRVRQLTIGELRFGARGDTPRVVSNMAAEIRLIDYAEGRALGGKHRQLHFNLAPGRGFA